MQIVNVFVDAKNEAIEITLQDGQVGKLSFEDVARLANFSVQKVYRLGLYPPKESKSLGEWRKGFGTRSEKMPTEKPAEVHPKLRLRLNSEANS